MGPSTFGLDDIFSSVTRDEKDEFGGERKQEHVKFERKKKNPVKNKILPKNR